MNNEPKSMARLVRERSQEIARDLHASYDAPMAMAVATYTLAMLARRFYRDGPAFERFVEDVLPQMLHDSPVETEALFREG
jgi:hypothetical protein